MLYYFAIQPCISGWGLKSAPSALPSGAGGLSGGHGFYMVEDPSRRRHVEGFGFFLERSAC